MHAVQGSCVSAYKGDGDQMACNAPFVLAAYELSSSSDFPNKQGCLCMCTPSRKRVC